MKANLQSRLVFLVVLLFGIALVGELTNTLRLYSVASTSNYPGIRAGDQFMGSNLLKPDRFDFIVYKARPGSGPQKNCVHRLCGLPGDTVEIRNSSLWVNGAPADDGLPLAHNYRGDAQAIAAIRREINDPDNYYYQEDANTFVICASDQLVGKGHAPVLRKVLGTGFVDEDIRAKYGQNWNPDQFGPVIVPEDHYFVLGDNRPNAMDSRFTGFVAKEDYIATIFR